MTTTEKAPGFTWRTTRGPAGDGKVNRYGTEARRDQAAQRWADADQQPVAREHWTPEAGWVTDPATPPMCQCWSGNRKQYRCHCDAIDGTGYCLTHQHIYRQVNGIAEPPRPPRAAPQRPDRAELPELTVPAQPYRNTVLDAEDGDTVVFYDTAEQRDADAIALAEAHQAIVHSARFVADDDRIRTVEQARWLSAGWLTEAHITPDADEYVTVDLRIVNTYEDLAGGYDEDGEYDEGDEDDNAIITVFDGVRIPAPPLQPMDERPDGDPEVEAFDYWLQTHIFAWTGVGISEGDSWYDVTVTFSADSSLLGEFDFGY
ncbi:MAG: hypothetical protein ABWZ30_01005 [Jiangellaceae bacterium]